ncbi:MAG: hypothetical protein EPN30_02090 [Actinomycetota bacterium]|nr:MAG: hypothetical protein EPN30_02090 [Actinomycetota bacterium]
MNPADSKHQFQAELSSLGTAIEEITARITAIADLLAKQKLDGYAHDLYQAERSLKSAMRSITKVRQS